MANSLFFRFIEGLMNFFAKFFSGSIIIRGIAKETDEENLQRSLIYRAAALPFTFIAFMRDKFFSRMWEGSAAVVFLRRLPARILSVPVSVFLESIGAGTAAYMACKYFGFTQSEFTFTDFFIAIPALCLLLFARAAKSSLYDALRGSGLFRLISYLFDFSLPDIAPLPMPHTIMHVFGVLLALAFTFFPPLYVLGAIVGIPAAILVIAYPFIGVLAAVFLMPFVPTMMIAAVIGAVSLLFFLKLLTDKKYSFKTDLTGIFIIIYIFITLFKGFTSLSPQTSINIALLTSLFMAVYFLVVSMTDSEKKLELLIFTFSTSALFTGIYGIFQSISGMRDTTWTDTAEFEGLTTRVFSTFANPNVFGEYLLLAIPVAAAAIIFVKKWPMKLYYAGVAVVLLANLALTYSRGCYLAIALSVLVFVLIMEKRLIVLFSAGIFVLPAVLPPAMLNRILGITNMEDSSSKYRVSIYQASVRILQDFWPSGVGQGPDAYNRVFPFYAFNDVTAQHAHNLFLQVFVETGIFGIAAFLAVFYCFFKTLFPFFYKIKDFKYKCFSAALISLMAGFILQSMFDYSFYNYKVYMLFFVVLAFARVCARCAGSKDAQEEPDKYAPQVTQCREESL
jgi:O-antigen ligase